MRRTLFLAALGSLLIAGTAYAVASDSELDALAAECRASEVEFETVREELDVVVRANTRPLFRRLMLDLWARVDGAGEKLAVERVLATLAAPGPAPSVSKTLHEATRQAGAEGIQAIRRTCAGIEGLIG